MDRYELVEPHNGQSTGRAVWFAATDIVAVRELSLSNYGPKAEVFIVGGVKFFVRANAEEVAVNAAQVQYDVQYLGDYLPDPEAEGVYEADEHGDDAEVYRIQ